MRSLRLIAHLSACRSASLSPEGPAAASDISTAGEDGYALLSIDLGNGLETELGRGGRGLVGE